MRQDRSSDTRRKSTEQGCRDFVMPEPSSASGTSRSPGPQSHPANSGMDLAGGGAGYQGTVGITRPAVHDSWASPPVGQALLPAVAGAVQRTTENSPEAPGPY